MDQFSRRIVSIGVFANRPDCRAVCAFLGRAIRRANTAPKYIICDRDSIFDCARAWRQNGVFMVALSKSDTLLRSKIALFVVVGSILVAKVDQSRECKNRWTSTERRF